jgi:hypothetical protein
MVLRRVAEGGGGDNEEKLLKDVERGSLFFLFHVPFPMSLEAFGIDLSD